MKIFFRADASLKIATGHIMRCLSLAEGLRLADRNEISFICRAESGNMIKYIEKQDYRVYTLPFDIDLKTDLDLTRDILEKQARADWLIVDHYELTIDWESALRQSVDKIMVIDDLPSRKHDCDILLDQNFSMKEDQYVGLVPENCIRLLGPKYTLLRPEFRKMRKKTKMHDGEIKRILIFMGGSDLANKTINAIKAVQMLKRPDIAIDIVIGSMNPNCDAIKDMVCQTENMTCHFNVSNMAELMLTADLCIGAGGTTTWERCALGLPSIVIVIADNQAEITKDMADEGYLVNTGWHEDISEYHIKEDLKFLLKHKGICRSLSKMAYTLVDGRGTLRVANIISDQKRADSITIRLAETKDCKAIFEMRNHPDVRRYFFDSSALSFQTHEHWFEKALLSAKMKLLVCFEDHRMTGVLRYDFENNKARISIYINPELFGMGYGSIIIDMGNDWLKKNSPDIEQVIAAIVPENKASIRAFEKAGFKEDYWTYTYNIKN